MIPFSHYFLVLILVLLVRLRNFRTYVFCIFNQWKLVAHQRFCVIICDHVISWAVLYHDFITVDKICCINFISKCLVFFQNLLFHHVQVSLCLCYHGKSHIPSPWNLNIQWISLTKSLSSTPFDSASVEIPELDFCLVELDIMAPLPRVNTTPVWLFISG